MKPRRVFAFLSLLLAAVTFGSLLYIPSAAKNRFRPLPPHARLVYNNRNPDWFLSFFPMLGKMNDDFSKQWRNAFLGLETSPLTVATVPLGGRERRNTWVAVSELDGPGALMLRWRLMLFPPDGVSALRPYAVWPVWKMEHSSIPRWAKVRFSLTEGLLICSISDDSHDIYKLLDTLDGRMASLADQQERRGVRE